MLLVYLVGVKSQCESVRVTTVCTAEQEGGSVFSSAGEKGGDEMRMEASGELVVNDPSCISVSPDLNYQVRVLRRLTRQSRNGSTVYALAGAIPNKTQDHKPSTTEYIGTCLST